jgi:hypothetical protein
MVILMFTFRAEAQAGFFAGLACAMVGSVLVMWDHRIAKDGDA